MRSNPLQICLLAAALAGSLGLAACSSGAGVPGGGDNNQITFEPAFNAANFVAGVDNQYFPLTPGRAWTYSEGDKTVVVTVTDRTKTILGVVSIEVHDQVTKTAGGDLVEDTLDWYAQDSAGNVWYMGEETAEYEGGVVVSTAGSWVAGVQGAIAGIIMPASPSVGQLYRQEFLAGEAEDMAEVQLLGASAAVPFGDYNANCVRTFDFTPLDSASKEQKYYAPGVGMVLAVNTLTGEREELTGIDLIQ